MDHYGIQNIQPAIHESNPHGEANLMMARHQICGGMGHWKSRSNNLRCFSRPWISFSILSLVLALFVLVHPLETQASDGPVILVWDGPYQVFGQPGMAQRWVNILGNVTVPEPLDVESLTYTLNGGPDMPLAMGPDDRRLVNPGDFNVEIDHADLVDGENEVIITATDNDDPPNETTETVTIDYAEGNVWPETYSIHWNTVDYVQDVAQIVDGNWDNLETDGVQGARILEMGYDRVLAIGDLDWDDYEITVPITVHGFDSGPLPPYSVSAGFGMTMRWTGHTDIPVSYTHLRAHET